MQVMIADDTTLRMLSKEGVDCFVNFKTGEVESYCRVDDSYMESNFNHFYVDREDVDIDNTETRLVNCSNEYRMEEVRVHQHFGEKHLFKALKD